MKKIITIIGARPQFIKASVVSSAITKNKSLQEMVVHTGQHFDENMSEVFFGELGIAKPSYNLNIHSGVHGEMTGRMLIEIEKVLIKENPDIVLIYGDTNSTLAGALAAVKLNIPVAHVEAGLRSFNRRMPEEINRIVADSVSHLLFTPTKLAEENLLKEGVSSQCIFPVGDVMYDVALHYGAQTTQEGRQIEKLGLMAKGYILATIHRAENTEVPQRLEAIMRGLCEVVIETMLPVILPLHPRTHKALKEVGGLEIFKKYLNIIAPVGYLDMVQLEKYAAVIATDSGGVQKEAFFYRVPCVTLRDETEWMELIDTGWNCIAPPHNVSAICSAILSSMNKQGKEISPYGDGNAAELIVETLDKYLKKSRNG